jgi:hypothetical protein
LTIIVIAAGVAVITVLVVHHYKTATAAGTILGIVVPVFASVGAAVFGVAVGYSAGTSAGAAAAAATRNLSVQHRRRREPRSRT